MYQKKCILLSSIKLLAFSFLVSFSQIGYAGKPGEINELAENDLYPIVEDIAKAGEDIAVIKEIKKDIRDIVEGASERFDRASKNECKLFCMIFTDAAKKFQVTPLLEGLPQERSAETVRKKALMYLSGGDQATEITGATYRTTRDKYKEVNDGQFDDSLLPLLGLKAMLAKLVDRLLPK